MGTNDLGALWDAWRTRSDEEALLQLLDEVGPELLRAARRYTRDESSAHDLVQETWQAALSKAHAYDAKQPLVPWLIGFLLVESKRERRRSSRNVDPERLHAREEPPPDHAASHDEQRRMVKSAVAALPVLYREVVELTYERGLEPAQIAEQLKRAPGTVRVQLHRGLAKLREALPAGLSLGVAIMLLGGTSEAALHASLAETALARADEIARAAPAATAAASGAWKFAAALALVAVGGGAVWWTFSSSGDAPDREAALERTSAQTSKAHEDLAIPGTKNTGRSAVAPVTPPAVASSAPGVFLLATVRGIEAGVGEFQVQLRAVNSKLEPLRAQVQAGERFELDVSAWYEDGAPHPQEFYCVLDDARSMPARVNVWLHSDQLAAAQKASDHSARVEIPVAIELHPALGVVTGRVRMPAGSAPDAALPVCAALFEEDPFGKPGAEPTEAIDVASDGSFRLRSPHGGAHLLVVVDDSSRPANVPLELQARTATDVGEIARDPGYSLSGSVRNADGTHVAGVRVTARLRNATRDESLHGHPVAWMSGRFERPGRDARTDEDGEFIIEGMAPLVCWVTADVTSTADGAKSALVLAIRSPADPSQGLRSYSVSATAPATSLVLGKVGSSVLLRVTSEGTPLAQASVVWVMDNGRTSPATTDDKGLIELVAREPATFRLRLAKPGYIPIFRRIETEEFAAGIALDVALKKGPPPSHVTFDTGSVTLGKALVFLSPFEEIDPAELADRASRETPFTVPGLLVLDLDATARTSEAISAGRYLGVIYDSAQNGANVSFQPTSFDIDVPAGVEYRFRVDLAVGGRFRVPPPQYSGNSARLTVEILDAQDASVPVTFTSAVLRSDARGGTTGGAGLYVKGSNLSSTLKPGTYTVRVTAPDAKPFEGHVVIETGKTAELSVALELR